ncbi:MAG: HpcH/HpaI aldolase/citrate lyase family protein [Cupriavidus necator]
MNSQSNAPRRSALYVPAINQRALNKAYGLDTDVLIFDLEDAVAPAMREQAREYLTTTFTERRFNLHETVIRVNENGSEDQHRDLEIVARCQPSAVLLPKVSHPEDLHQFAALARAQGVPDDTQLWIMIETASGLTHLREIVAAGKETTPRLQCLIVGTNDIAKETGVSCNDGRAYLMPWLMNIVLAAKHGGLCVLDGVWNDFSDMHGFESETRQSAMMAFNGKTLIHPSQVEGANRLFSPSASAIEDALRIVDAYARPENAVVGAVNLDGKMAERLHLAQANHLLAVHQALEARAAARKAARNSM